MTRAAILVAIVVASLTYASARVDADSVGTLQVSGTFTSAFHGVSCAAGSPATTNCYLEVGTGSDAIAGLGNIKATYTLIQDNFGSACGHVHARIPVVVAGKGEIDLETKTTGCIKPESPDVFPASTVTVAGATGLYAGASGSGVLEYRNVEQGGVTGRSTLTWTGTVTVAGLAFDITPPLIRGATARLVKTKSAAGVKVRYLVKATDAIDGAVAAACLPKSGSFFPVGRTTVSCSPIDNSGNPATARFTVTVKRIRR